MSRDSKTVYPVMQGNPFDTMGLFTFLRTYARRHSENDPNSTVENWQETLERVVNACNNQLHVGFSEAEKIELFKLLYSLKCSVAGRFLWQLGTQTVDRLGIPSLQNCAHVVVDEPIRPFTWAMNFLMLGAGVGYRILPSDVEKFPQVKYALITRKDTKDADYIVPDSREGWVKLLGKVLKAHFYSGQGFTFSCTLLRSKGAPIKSFGGVASGPEVLCDGIEKITLLLNRRAGHAMRAVDALDIMNIIGMIVVSGNVRRCLPKGALVHTQNGLIPIENITVGTKVLTTEGYKNVTNTFTQGTQKLIKICTEDGEFECTSNHKMPVLVSRNQYEWKEAGQLLPDDRIISSRMIIPGEKTCLPEWKYERPAHSTTCKDITVPELDEDMAWFIGVFQGDGYTYPNYENNGFNAYVSLIFGLDEYDIAEKAQQQLERFGDLHVSLKKRKNENSYIVHCQSKQLSWYLDQNVKKAKVPICVPKCILCGTPEIRLAYVSGLCDADGCTKNRPIQVISTVYEQFAKDIQTVLYSCGIESRFKRGKDWPSRNGWQLNYSVNLITLRAQKEFSQIPTLFKTLRQNSKSQNANSYPAEFVSAKVHRKYGLYSNRNMNIDSYDKEYGEDIWCPVRVVKIEESGENETFDIEVDEKHEFFCNGYLTHNSAQIAIGDCKDTDFLRAKRWDLGNIPNWRAFSNNSVVCNDIRDIIDNEDFWKGYDGTGEPYGLINLKLSQSCGRLGDGQVDPNVCGYNPCAEISLSNHETCCLAEIFLPNISSKEELFKCATYVYRICKHSLTLPCDSKETERIVHQNMRIGIGVTGYLQATDEQRSWLSDCYDHLRKFDKQYSIEHGFPVSIKLTTTKPSGTLSILGNCTSGVHPGFARYYKRRIRIASESALIALAKSHGYPVEYVQNFDGSLDHTTQIVTFPQRLPDNTVLAEDCSAIEQLEWVKKVQTEWSDNSVSVTVYYRKHELPAIKEWLLKNYNQSVKTVSFLLHNDHGFKQAPMEQITKQEYEVLAANCRPIVDLKGVCYSADDVNVLADEKDCASGACPRK